MNSTPFRKEMQKSDFGRDGYGWCAPGSRQNTLIMASQAEPAAKVLAVADHRHGSGASALATPSTSSGASSSELPPPDGELSDASGSSDDESEGGADMFSDEEGDCDGLQSDDEREHVESMTTDDSAMEDSQPAAALEQEASGQPKAPAGPLSP